MLAKGFPNSIGRFMAGLTVVGLMILQTPAAGVPPAPAMSGTSASLEEIAPDSVQPRGPVLGLEIVGNKSLSDAEIRRHIKSRKDRPYDSQLLQEDLRRLYATRKFHNVRVTKKVVPQGVFITFEVIERPTIDDVLFIGNRYISDKTLQNESGLAKGDALNIYAVQEARRKVEEYYQSKGYAKTQVSILEGDKAQHRRVVLRVDEGRIERIWSVRFVGNDPSIATDARLKAHVIKSKPGFMKYLFGGKVDYSVIEEDTERLTVYYRNLGFLRATVSREIETDDSGQWINLTFVINEGPRYRVRNISVAGNELFDSNALLQQMDLQAGEYFNQAKLRHDERKLRDLYGGHGHIFADIEASPILDEEPGILDIVFRIDEGELFRVGEINIQVAGEYPQTRRSVILNRLSFRPGDIVDIREVRASERRLKSSQLFVTNPAEGPPPQIVIRPPSLAEMETLAKKRSSATYRGQSPDESSGRHVVRKMIIDVICPPICDDAR
jgi:outer membrane protein insertion porin family